MRAKLDKLTGNLRESDLPSGVDLSAMQQQAHRHDNKSVLDKIGEADGNLLFDGVAVGGGDSVATQTENGLMSAADKVKLDGLGGVATQTANGLMSAADKVKLDGLVQAQIGSIALFSGSSIPTGYLLCDGSALSRTVYAELFSAIGTAWGEGDGSTTFNLPDLTDKTVWGGDSEAVGCYKEAGLPNVEAEYVHTGDYHGYDEGTFSGALAKTGTKTVSYLRGGDGSTSYHSGYTFDASRSSSVYGNSTTVQPPAAVMQFCIKYM